MLKTLSRYVRSNMRNLQTAQNDVKTLVSKSIYDVQCAHCKKTKFLYEIKTVEKNDQQDILNLLETVFLKDEPFVNSFGLNDQQRKQLAQCILPATNQGLSLIARQTTTDEPNKKPGKPLGFAININTSKRDLDREKEKLNLVKDATLRKLFRFWIYVTEAPNLWETYKVKNIFELSFLATVPEARGCGLARKLIEKSIKIAKKENYSIFRVDASNFLTAKLCENFKMTRTYLVPYEQYCDPFEKASLPSIKINPKLNKYCTVYILRLKNRNENPDSFVSYLCREN